MNVSPALMAVIACPASHGDLSAVEGQDGTGGELVCSGCGLAYPVQDDIPVLLVAEARRPE